MSGARTRRAKRLARIFPIAAQLSAHGQECDDIWWARRDSRHDWFELTTPISRNSRGDTPLAESNFRVTERLLNEGSAFGFSYRYDLWPGGQIQTIVIRTDDAGALRTIQGIVNALSDYPVLSDDDHSELQWEEDHPSETECYSEYECCSKCGKCDKVIREDMVDQVFEDHETWCDLHPDNQED